ncbi:MAG TPA: hypothetical protein PLS84_11285 [Salinivirgaceae bacterium]|nr:hypothetical protein [Salinivirgaceae bacterium]
MLEKIKALNMLSENINPTIIYNEGWIVRLLVIESMLEKITIENIEFGKLANKKWSSEALIASPFVTTKINREGYTHADIILGDFDVNYGERGKVVLADMPEILGIIEAKMGSSLSKGTRNAPNYNQASRNICCLAHTTQSTDCGTFFIIAAPQSIIKKYNNFEEQINQIKPQISERFSHSEISYSKEIEKKVSECKVSVISYEDWINKLKHAEIKNMLIDFYNQCKKYNKIQD